MTTPGTAQPSTGKVKTVSEYLERVFALADADHNATFWYRGSKDRFPLVPGAYRKLDPLGVDEYTIATNFKSRALPLLDVLSRPYGATETALDWQWYAMMQHYRAPTRLLDWTEAPLVALFFSHYEIEEANNDPCVWVLRPELLNKCSTGEYCVYVPDGEFTAHWLFRRNAQDGRRCILGKPTGFRFAKKSYSNAHPIAIEPPKLNRRLLAQQGTFTVHGGENTDLAEYAERQGAIVRIDIDRAAIELIRHQLQQLGITGASLFPELTELADQIMAEHQDH